MHSASMPNPVFLTLAPMCYAAYILISWWSAECETRSVHFPNSLSTDFIDHEGVKSWVNLVQMGAELWSCCADPRCSPMRGPPFYGDHILIKSLSILTVSRPHEKIASTYLYSCIFFYRMYYEMLYDKVFQLN